MYSELLDATTAEYVGPTTAEYVGPTPVGPTYSAVVGAANDDDDNHNYHGDLQEGQGSFAAHEDEESGMQMLEMDEESEGQLLQMDEEETKDNWPSLSLRSSLNENKKTRMLKFKKSFCDIYFQPHFSTI